MVEEGTRTKRETAQVEEQVPSSDDDPDEVVVKEGSIVFHKKYREGVVTTIVSDKLYVEFDDRQKRIFDYPDAIEKGWLSLS